MAVVEVRTSLCASEHIGGRSGVIPACRCGWKGNISYGSAVEAEEAWATYHRPQQGAAHDAAVDGIYVLLHEPEQIDPARPRIDPAGEWIKVPPRSNQALRRGEEGVEQRWRR